MKFIKSFFREYLFLNLFIFTCVALLSLVVVNFSFFDPFTQAFRDFSLTDLYYSKIKERNEIYKGPVVLVNIENKNRTEIAFLLQQIETGKPTVVALDFLLKKHNSPQDSILKLVFDESKNIVYNFIADFDNENNNEYNDFIFTTKADGYSNLVAENIEYFTVRNYFPFYQNHEAFTTAIIKKYDSLLYKDLLKWKNKKAEIHYTGNLSNFTYYTFNEVTNPDFNTTSFKNKIVLVGYFGLDETKAGNLRLDEDKFFTPLNHQLSGRSYPDMYGVVIHANILRMILEHNYIRVVPTWLVILISFIILWFILPFMCGLFFKGDIWFNTAGTLLQLGGSIFVVFFCVLIYRYCNIKFDPGILLTCLVLLPTFINLYEALLVFLRHKIKIPVRSAFLEKDAHD